jgi:predicted nucleotidyltransferase
MKKAILKTLAYADIFDYPLRAQEIERFLIANKSHNFASLNQTLKKLSPISQKEGFYFLKGKEKTVALRKKREKWSQEKLKIAKKVTNWLKLVPSIKMVAATGALAMENAKEKDDIDLLIITSKNRLWLTRALTVFLTELVAKRRHPRDKQVKDKICLNMFLDEGHLQIPKNEQDLFSAHEICQLKLIWDRNKTYQKFIKQNQWVKHYLPNWKP